MDLSLLFGRGLWKYMERWAGKPLSSQWAFLWQLGSYWVECRQLEPGLWDFRRKFGECLSYSQGYLCYIFMKTMWKDRRHAPWWIALAVLSEDLVWSPVPSWWLTISLPVDPLLSSDLHKNCCMHSWWIDIKASYILEKKRIHQREVFCVLLGQTMLLGWSWKSIRD